MVSVCHLEQCICASFTFFLWYRKIVKAGLKHISPIILRYKTMTLDLVYLYNIDFFFFCRNVYILKNISLISQYTKISINCSLNFKIFTLSPPKKNKELLLNNDIHSKEKHNFFLCIAIFL